MQYALCPQGDARRGLEHEQRREARRAGIGCVCGGIDLGNVEATHPRVSCKQACDATQLVRLQPARHRGRAARCDAAIAHVDVKVDMNRAPAPARRQA